MRPHPIMATRYFCCWLWPPKAKFAAIDSIKNFRLSIVFLLPADRDCSGSAILYILQPFLNVDRAGWEAGLDQSSPALSSIGCDESTNSHTRLESRALMPASCRPF